MSGLASLSDASDGLSLKLEGGPSRPLFNYTVTIVDILPNDVEAVKRALKKILEQAQAQAQRDAVEQKK